MAEDPASFPRPRALACRAASRESEARPWNHRYPLAAASRFSARINSMISTCGISLRSRAYSGKMGPAHLRFKGSGMRLLCVALLLLGMAYGAEKDQAPITL